MPCHAMPCHAMRRERANDALARPFVKWAACVAKWSETEIRLVERCGSTACQKAGTRPTSVCECREQDVCVCLDHRNVIQAGGFGERSHFERRLSRDPWGECARGGRAREAEGNWSREVGGMHDDDDDDDVAPTARGAKIKQDRRNKHRRPASQAAE
ncbi:hypothetical protein BKA80DRAFT_264332 [Phyllosticta citrichinensis]